MNKANRSGADARSATFSILNKVLIYPEFMPNCSQWRLLFLWNEWIYTSILSLTYVNRTLRVSVCLCEARILDLSAPEHQNTKQVVFLSWSWLCCLVALSVKWVVTAAQWQIAFASSLSAECQVVRRNMSEYDAHGHSLTIVYCIIVLADFLFSQRQVSHEMITTSL